MEKELDREEKKFHQNKSKEKQKTRIAETRMEARHKANEKKAVE